MQEIDDDQTVHAIFISYKSLLFGMYLAEKKNSYVRYGKSEAIILPESSFPLFVEHDTPIFYDS